MHVDGTHYRTIWREGATIRTIDQRRLPFAFEVLDLQTTDDAVAAIADMAVRGAGLIGVTAAYGMELAARGAAALEPAARADALAAAAEALIASRPTAVNLAWAVDRQRRALAAVDPADGDALVATAAAVADEVAAEDVAMSRAIGEHGLPLLRAIHERTGRPVQVLTHCNAGWLAFVDHGTATSPIYAAHDAGIPVHVWVDETRPRNQGARLTAWELGQHGVPHTLVADNAGGHLMQQGQVDLVIVGTDRTSASGDVANKIGTYLKALAAHDNDVPFYVALPSSSIDWDLHDGVGGTPIELRGADEVLVMEGVTAGGEVVEVRIAPEGTPAANAAFDVTPARLVTGLITERGVCAADRGAIAAMFPDLAR
ncbi:MAG: S-methyl-5-thioribose-1-phosphate isomerase [Acidimicrobiales bacterium]